MSMLLDKCMDLRCDTQQHAFEAEALALRPDAGQALLVSTHQHLMDASLLLRLWGQIRAILTDLEEVSLRDTDLNAISHFFRVFLSDVEGQVPLGFRIFTANLKFVSTNSSF